MGLFDSFVRLGIKDENGAGEEWKGRAGVGLKEEGGELGGW